MNFTGLIPSFLICTIPILAALACMLVLMKDFRLVYGFGAVFLGLFSVVPIAVIQFFLDIKADSLFSILLKSILINGFVEEFIKMIFLFLFPCKKMSLKVFFACALLSGLSIGCFETLVYIASGIHRLELRFFTAVVIHSCCAGLSSLFVFNIKNGSVRIYPFVLSVLLHGVYNYFAGFRMDSVFFWFSLAVVVVSVVECRIRYRAMAPEGLLLFS
ncbi:PrsW family glutamic-type intramembrane protease [Treponema sp.]|uniref:PrsW family glutamic-type intramembrane protease n=1 Tax=Treponema sp. TaxID=166 RepID=UPI003F031821